MLSLLDLGHADEQPREEHLTPRTRAAAGWTHGRMGLQAGRVGLQAAVLASLVQVCHGGDAVGRVVLEQSVDLVREDVHAAPRRQCHELRLPLAAHQRASGIVRFVDEQELRVLSHRGLRGAWVDLPASRRGELYPGHLATGVHRRLLRRLVRGIEDDGVRVRVG